MSKTEAKVQIIVPPQLGYGNHELEKIPQNTILIYEIEIVNIK
jgi:FKBP-type peptidyl-prolyl cis-trans isomerase